MEGGTLTILKECLESASANFSNEWVLIALVHKKNLLNISGIKFVEYPNVKNSWIYRLYFEWIYCYFFSRKIKPDLWISLHDITPNVITKRKIVYCHNPSPFYEILSTKVLYDFKFLMFCLCYKFLYKINIKSNYMVIVQQEWIRNKFKNLFGNLNILVAYPSIEIINSRSIFKNKINQDLHKYIFFYPSLPRVFKNFEVIFEALNYINPNLRGMIEIWITVDGKENRYARHLFKTYSSLEEIKFLGAQSYERMQELYDLCNVVIFPSEIETWGLPITEAKKFFKPIFVNNKLYAHETVGDYEFTKFISGSDPKIWALYIESFMNGTLEYDCTSNLQPEQPFASNWLEMWKVLKAGL